MTTVVNTTKPERPFVTPLVSYRVYLLFALVNDHFLACSISLFGMFTNSANIAVFLRMGFAESTNISFFALSIIDLLICFYTFTGKLLYSYWLYTLHGNYKTREAGHGSTFIAFATTGVGAWVTAIISLERCFCIMFPLKVSYSNTPVFGLSFTSSVDIVGLIFLLSKNL